MLKAVPFGYACGQWVEEILTCQNLLGVEVQELAPDGDPWCCVGIGELVVQLRIPQEVLDSGFERQAEDCPL